MADKKKATPRKKAATPPGPPDWKEDGANQMSPAARELYEQEKNAASSSSSGDRPQRPARQ